MFNVKRTPFFLHWFIFRILLPSVVGLGHYSSRSCFVTALLIQKEITNLQSISSADQSDNIQVPLLFSLTAEVNGTNNHMYYKMLFGCF